MNPHARANINSFFKLKFEGIVVTAYASLGAPGLMGGKECANLLKNETILKVAERLGKSASQVKDFSSNF